MFLSLTFDVFVVNIFTGWILIEKPYFALLWHLMSPKIDFLVGS